MQVVNGAWATVEIDVEVAIVVGLVEGALVVQAVLVLVAVALVECKLTVEKLPVKASALGDEHDSERELLILVGSMVQLQGALPQLQCR